MRQDTLWQGNRREARLHWWQEVLDQPATATKREEAFDEALSMRFRASVDAESCPDTGSSGRLVELGLAARWLALGGIQRAS